MRMLKGLVGAALVASTAPIEAEYKSPLVQRAENTLKMIIGLNHQRCAEVVYVEKLQGSVYGVTCIKRAGNKQRVHYAVDGANNAVVSVN